MSLSATSVPVREILPWRERYRQEMQCQIVHDSLHGREGWTRSYLLNSGPTVAGYGAVAVGGPWKGTATLFELFLAPAHRDRAADFFATLVAAADISGFEVQTNDRLLTELLSPWPPGTACEKIVFHDQHPTALPANGARLRRAAPADAARIFPHRDEPVGDWLLEVEGQVAATGGILYHYNRPYGDIYMETAESFRRRGLGSYLVQELKRLCREGGSVPCARCSPANVASFQTLQKAGFTECARIMVGPLTRRSI